MPASSSGSAAEDTERAPLLTPITSESYAGPVEVTNNQYRARDVHVSYPLLKFSIAWLGMWSKNRIPAFVLSFSVCSYNPSCYLNDGKNWPVWGVFLANADLGLVLATYSSIASDLRDLEHGAWLIAGYQLGYSVALPAVSRSSTLWKYCCLCVALGWQWSASEDCAKHWTIFRIFFWKNSTLGKHSVQYCKCQSTRWLVQYGAVSDAYGRKVPLLVGYALFGFGSLLAWVLPLPF